MAAIFYRLLRISCMGLTAAWILASLWCWWVPGSYESCGIGTRFLGFLVWGIMPGLLPCILSLPASDKDAKLKWTAPMPLPVALFLLCWLGGLCCIITDPPGACSDGAILALSGLLLFFYQIVGIALLSLLYAGLKRLLRRR
jgi:hypothetical protein